MRVKHESAAKVAVRRHEPRQEAKRGAQARGMSGSAPSKQYAALPYRLNDGVEVLLITSRDTGRWVLPKGWPIKGEKGHAAAAREAVEEAGVKGTVWKTAVGAYSYGKRLGDGAVVNCSVEVYPLSVERQLETWPEYGERSSCWFRARDAGRHVMEPELTALIDAFATTLLA